MKLSQQEEAKQLFFTTNKTQKEIADAVGVSDRTIRLWIKDQAWDKLKQRALEMPSIIVDNICTQIINMQNDILARDGGKPTIEETTITHKLVLCLMKMKNYPSSGSLMQFMQHFITQTCEGDRDFTFELTRRAGALFRAKEKNNLMSLDLEYDITPSYFKNSSPSAPLETELETAVSPSPSTPVERAPGAEVSFSAQPEIMDFPVVEQIDSKQLTLEFTPETEFPHAAKSGTFPIEQVEMKQAPEDLPASSQDNPKQIESSPQPPSRNGKKLWKPRGTSVRYNFNNDSRTPEEKEAARQKAKQATLDSMKRDYEKPKRRNNRY